MLSRTTALGSISLRAFGATAVLAAALLPALSSTDSRPAPPPSILLVTFDTTRADHVGCYGAAFAATPTLDALAKRGVRFDQALSPAPLTLPAHSSLMTGRPPRLHGVRDNFGFKLAATETTLATQLRAAGYRTSAFVSAAVLDRVTGIDRGFDAFDDQVRVGRQEWFAWEERAASQTMGSVVAQLGELKPPFFLWVHLYDPHLPYVPPEPYATLFKDRPYDGEIAFADAQLGRLLGELGQRGLDKQLLIAVAGDHGESLGEHGEKTHDVFVYQATLRVPLILTGPGVPAGRVVKDPVGLIDVAPTLLDLAGVKSLEHATGRSLRPLLAGQRLPRAEYEAESLYPALAYGWAPVRALIAWPLKYIAVPRPELYDLGADPRERSDLAAARPAALQKLAASLRARFGADLETRPAAKPAETPEEAERQAQLRSLGYAGGSAAPSTTSGPLIDPKDGIVTLAALDDARAALQRGEPARAVTLLEPLVAKNPENVPARLSLGNAYLSVGQVDRAIALHRETAQRVPGDYLPHFNLANALRVAGRSKAAALTEAEQEFRAALAIHPRHAGSVQGLAEMVAARGDTQGAREVLAEADRRGLVDPSLLVLRGAIEAQLGDVAAADRAFARALTLDPRFARALEARGKLAYQRKDARAAADFYRQALDAEPTVDRARTLGSVLLYDLDDRAGARTAFERALALKPNPRDAAAIRDVLAELR